MEVPAVIGFEHPLRRLELAGLLKCDDQFGGIAEIGARIGKLGPETDVGDASADIEADGGIGQLDVGSVLREEYEPMLQAIVECPIPTIAARYVTTTIQSNGFSR